MEPKIYLPQDHSIDSDLIDPDALFVITKLQSAGYTAYLVGGSVRDLLTKTKPKDYDISTSAEPEDVKRVFGRRCILIGRRFRLAHVRFGKKIIEVATFRTGDTGDDDLIVRDNEWGSPEEDASRRDFTMNGLFYDAHHKTVIDYVGGWQDLQKGVLRTIGDPDVRFRQDPVRMIRLLKFRARLGFEIDSDTLHSLERCRDAITQSSPARIVEEFFRMLESGASAEFMRLLMTHGLLSLLFPAIQRVLESDMAPKIYNYLESADKLHLDQSPQTLERSTLLSCILYPILEAEIEKQFLSKGKTPHLGDIALLTAALTNDLVTSSFPQFPKRITSAVNHIMANQYRITPLKQRRSSRHKLMRMKEFPMALRFFRVRTLVHPQLKNLYDSWLTEYREVEHHGDRRPYTPGPSTPKRKRRRRRRSSDEGA